LAWGSFTANGGCAATSFSVPVQKFALCGNPRAWDPVSNPGCVNSWPANHHNHPCKPFDSIKKKLTGKYHSYDLPNCIPQQIDVEDKEGWDSGSKFSEIFNHGPAQSCSEILHTSPTSLEAYLCAAYLNAVTHDNYAMSVHDVLEVSRGKIGSSENFGVQDCIEYLKQTMHEG
jgi:hypothetical protein